MSSCVSKEINQIGQNENIFYPGGPDPGKSVHAKTLPALSALFPGNRNVKKSLENFMRFRQYKPNAF
jgi:hypothetical protein